MSRRYRHKQVGFTLTEVLIAMAILSTAIVSMLALISQNVRITTDIEQQFLAGIVAENVLAETLIPFTLPPDLALAGEATLGNQTWRWQRQIEETSIAGMFQVTVTVRSLENDRVFGTITAFREGA